MDTERQKKSMSAHPLYHSTIDKPLQKDKKVSKYAELKVCQVLHSFCTYWDYSLQDIVDRHDDNIAILQEALKKSRVRSLQLLAVLGVLLVIITASLSGALVQKAVQITNIKEEQQLTNGRIADIKKGAFAKIEDLEEEIDGKTYLICSVCCGQSIGQTKSIE